MNTNSSIRDTLEPLIDTWNQIKELLSWRKDT